jgi:hypothetical protein
MCAPPPGEEMGIDTPVERRSASGTRPSGERLTETNWTHVFFGRWNGLLTRSEEADDWKFLTPMNWSRTCTQPERYTVWLRACWDQVRAHLYGGHNVPHSDLPPC